MIPNSPLGDVSSFGSGSLKIAISPKRALRSRDKSGLIPTTISCGVIGEERADGSMLDVAMMLATKSGYSFWEVCISGSQSLFSHDLWTSLIKSFHLPFMSSQLGELHPHSSALTVDVTDLKTFSASVRRVPGGWPHCLELVQHCSQPICHLLLLPSMLVFSPVCSPRSRL